DDFLNAAAPDASDRAVEHAELVERVTRALASLPPRYRTPLRLYHLDGLSHERVAEALGIPVTTVRSLVHRARRKLAKLLADDSLPNTEHLASGVWHLEDLFETHAEPRSMLHVINGDSTRASLELSNVPGRFTVWGDVLYEGPVPRDVPDEVFAEARARFHASEAISYEDALAMHRRWDAGLESSRDADEVVLWFEHDLHDQLLLVRLLDWFATRKPKALSLICIGEFPTVEPFHGLGQLTPDQLASLLDTRQRVSERQLALGQSTWRAFTGEDPTALERIIARDTSALPFLDGALQRLLEDFPDVRTGLPRTERTILEILASRGELKFGKLFPAQQQTEERVFMGDWTFWRRLEDLERGARPLVRIERENNARNLDARVTITEDGRRVLAGDLDWMAIAPFDRWIGGTHLVAPDIAWHWDPTTRRLVGSPTRGE
ncbi:MAG TPA: sigma-70 family RNA polymerase sigma factor, partial [Gemmatimonadaceae bacterium]